MTGEGVTCSFLPFITAQRWVGVAWNMPPQSPQQAHCTHCFTSHRYSLSTCYLLTQRFSHVNSFSSHNG